MPQAGFTVTVQNQPPIHAGDTITASWTRNSASSVGKAALRCDQDGVRVLDAKALNPLMSSQQSGQFSFVADSPAWDYSKPASCKAQIISEFYKAGEVVREKIIAEDAFTTEPR